MTIKYAMLNAKFGIFGLQNKTPELWDRRICLFDTLEEAKDFYEKENMAWGLRHPQSGLYIFEIVDGIRQPNPYDFPELLALSPERKQTEVKV